jgi:hypothetical protein
VERIFSFRRVNGQKKLVKTDLLPYPLGVVTLVEPLVMRNAVLTVNPAAVEISYLTSLFLKEE